ncbi:MAG: hypothetical protein SNJ72_02005 [Fimbriimonadales bacterium]
MREEYDFVNRMAVVTELAKKEPGMGRTKLMKYMYLLQTVKSVPLGYHFQLYIYGPYDPTVLSDLGMAEVWEAVEEKIIFHSNGYGYEIRPAHKAEQLLTRAKEFLQRHSEAIEWVVENFRRYSAGELELISTMIWADREAKRAKETWTIEETLDIVLKIKPLFPPEQAKRIADELTKLGIWQAVQTIFQK